MDAIAIMTDIKLAVNLAKMAYDMERDASPFIKTAYEVQFKNRILTTNERESMIKQEQTWRSNIDAVIAEDDKATD